jgi:hypothetical protein
LSVQVLPGIDVGVVFKRGQREGFSALELLPAEIESKSWFSLLLLVDEEKTNAHFYKK